MSIDLSFLDGALSSITLQGVFSAVINLVICLIVIRILTSLARRAIRHTQLDDRLQRFLMTGLRTLLYVVTVIIVAQSLGIPSSSLIALPNSSISSEKITNYTTLGQRRITVTVGASYDAPTADVRAALLEAAANTEHLLSDPAPTAYVSAYLDSSIEYVLYAWSTADDLSLIHI